MEKLYLKKRSKRKSSLNQTSSGRDKFKRVSSKERSVRDLGDHSRRSRSGRTRPPQFGGRVNVVSQTGARRPPAHPNDGIAAVARRGRVRPAPGRHRVGWDCRDRRSVTAQAAKPSMPPSTPKEATAPKRRTRPRPRAACAPHSSQGWARLARGPREGWF